MLIRAQGLFRFGLTGQQHVIGRHHFADFVARTPLQRLLLAFLGVAGQRFAQLGQRTADLQMHRGGHRDRQQDGQGQQGGGVRAAAVGRALQELALVDHHFEAAQLQLLAAFLADQFARNRILVGRTGAGLRSRLAGALIMLQHLAIRRDQAGADQIGIAGADIEQTVDRILVEAPHRVGEGGGLCRSEMIGTKGRFQAGLIVQLSFQDRENPNSDQHRDQ